ncbi:TPA: hypothetical protein N0F65_007831 [Lagenidium giganteum]|uniref:Cystatin domain-containing protein n=1 Tax=Lagenidium giganteum TaxID=4803 RepID=A0AAV2YYW6_9STRA|nr:TPA: hypothetical protein N0F65_007831 [Lagenidium giganteum]
MAFLKIIACTLLAFLSSPATADNLRTGGWAPTTVTQQHAALLVTALSFYAGDMEPVCFKNILSLDTQVVAGMNYHYRVMACRVNGVTAAGVCWIDNDCAPQLYEVVVFSQPWSQTLKVTDIKPTQ